MLRLVYRHRRLLFGASHVRVVSTTKRGKGGEGKQVVQNEEAKYERKTPHEHVLLRPGMYLGQIEPSVSDTWVWNEVTKKMEKRALNYSPALLKIFDEILVNAADNLQRDDKMTSIDVRIELLGSKKQGRGLRISVRNDGKGIPIQKHVKENLYMPELVFGNLLTGSNFDDKQQLLTGGRHGYGAKLTNIFSKSFLIETSDSERKLSYKQEWRNKMLECDPPLVVETAANTTSSSDFTQVTFEPDLALFGIDKWSPPRSPTDAATAASSVATASVSKKKKPTKNAIVASSSSSSSSLPPGASPTTTLSSSSSDPLEDTVKMMKRRVVDIAACVGRGQVRVSLNGKPVPVKDFEDYVKLFASSSSEKKDAENTFFCRVGDRWDVAVIHSPTSYYEHQSFVNAVWTPRGGTHLSLVSAQVSDAINEALVKQGHLCPTSLIRNKMMVFVRAAVANPSFDSQSKDALTTPSSAWGSQCILPASFLKRIIQTSGIVEEVLLDLESKEQGKLNRAASNRGSSKMVNVPKLEDAHLAGTARSGECALILTEGDSAKALAVAGLEVLGRERYGVLPLRGKILNVRGASKKQLRENREVLNLVKALGLNFDREYTDTKRNVGASNAEDPESSRDSTSGVHGQDLRYGKVLIMTDQDQDGAHIKGLVINFFQKLWPSLLNVEGFLQQFVTPLVKVRTTNSSKKEAAELLSFYSLPEYEKWTQQRADAAATKALPTSGSSKKKSVDVNNTKVHVKYYKGLGTNTAEEGRTYFGTLDQHRKLFFNSSVAETSEVVDLAFSKSRAKDRRRWLEEKHDPKAFIDPSQKRVSYQQFIDTELIQFSFADNHRSIPSAIDGLKPAQRKVLFGCFKKNLQGEEIKVVQLAGYIAEQTCYHHGEASLHSTIINMAQDFVGSNNVPLLAAGGQFGTRAQGGKDFASPRYIFTALSPLARCLYPEADDNQLEYVTEDGLQVEPRFFVPVVPTLLINGAHGIGTGWSCFVPSHNPLDVVDHVARMVRGEASRNKPLMPWIKGFKGEIEQASSMGVGSDVYKTRGIATRTSPTTIEISELPYGSWTDNYKKRLIKLSEMQAIRGFTENHTSSSVRFILNASRQQADALEEQGLIKMLRLETKLSLQNMHAFDRHGKIIKYHSAEQICDEHFDVRLEAYQRRKKALSVKYKLDEEISRNKSRFVSEILSKELNLLPTGGASMSIAESALVTDLRQKGYTSAMELQKMSESGSNPLLLEAPGDGSGNSLSNNSNSDSRSRREFGYLLDMPIQSLTEERVVALRKASDEATKRLEALLALSPQDLWMQDLNILRDKLSEYSSASSATFSSPATAKTTRRKK